MNRLVNMVLRRLLRIGMQRMTKGQKVDPNAQRAAKSLRTVDRVRKL